jgi:hypothetical protein
VTVFNNRNTERNVPQIVAHQIWDGQNLLCQAKVLSVHREHTAGGITVTVPNQLELSFPAQRQAPAMVMKLKLDRLRVNGSEADAAHNPRLYEKPKLQPSYDLARGVPPAAIPTGIQRTGGVRR